MMQDFQSLDPDLISDSLKTERIGSKVVVFSSTSSTNDIAWSYAKNPDNDGLAVFSEFQNAGRGRRGNQWLSAPRQSLLLSVLLKKTNIKTEFFTLLCGVALSEVLIAISVKHVSIKWPNDILVDGKKIAGILVESKNDKVVLGIGINIHQQPYDFPPEISKAATSLDIQTGKICDRNIIASQTLNLMEKWVKIAQTDKDKVIRKWKSFSSLLGTRVGIEYNNQKYYGNCIGLDPESGLILQIEGGGVRMFEAAYSSIIKKI